MFSFIWPGVASPSAKNEVHNRSALLVLALATLMDDLLPKSNQAGLPNKSFLAFVWQIGLVAWETAAEAGRKV